MAAFADLSELLNRATGGNSGTPEPLFFFKDARVGGAAATAPIAGRMASLWQYDGQPSHGAAPTTVAIPDNTTQGGLKQTDPGGGREKWLTFAGGGALVPGQLIIYDRLLHIGNLSGTVTTAQTVGGTLTRYTNGTGNMIMVEIYTTVGTTATTITASYTDQAGNTGNTTQAAAFGATNNREATRAIILPLAAGDTGVQAVASVTVLATTGTAGNFGVSIIHPLLSIGMPVLGAGGDMPCLSKGMGPVEVETDACLGMLWIPNTTTAPQIFGSLFMCER